MWRWHPAFVRRLLPSGSHLGDRSHSKPTSAHSAPLLVAPLIPLDPESAQETAEAALKMH
jgi:hypothetical protein